MIPTDMLISVFVQGLTTCLFDCPSNYTFATRVHFLPIQSKKERKHLLLIEAILVPRPKSRLGVAAISSPTSPKRDRSFGPPVSYPEFPFDYVPVLPESIKGMSIPYPASIPHQMFMQYIDPDLYSKVINQIGYYFSNENLVKEIYLRHNMDGEGWVPIELIAGFKQVKKLTNNIAFIMEAIQTSTVVEVKDDKVRRRNDWIKWLMPGSLNVPGCPVTFVARDKENADIPSTPSPSGHPS